MSALRAAGGGMPSAPRATDQARLRAWLEHVAQTAIDWLDDLDRLAEELEDDEAETGPEIVR